MLLALSRSSRLCTLWFMAAVMMTVIARLPKKVTSIQNSRACPSIASALAAPQMNRLAALNDTSSIMVRVFGTGNNRASKCSGSPYRPFEMLHQRFGRGDSYTWAYRRTKDGIVITSWERYTVAQVDYPHLVMEMASKFQAQDPFQTHHRMILHIEQHLHAVDTEKDWALVAFEYKDDTNDTTSSHGNNSQWHQLGQGQNVQAFEEKFNLFLMPHANGTGGLVQEPTLIKRAITIYNSSSLSMIAATITRPLRHLYTQSWYACQPDELAGIAIWKDFGEYTFALLERERNGVTQVFDVKPGDLPFDNHGS